MCGIGLVVLGCAPEATQTLRPIMGDEIVGIWRQGETAYYLQFNADGTFNSATSVAALGSAPIDFGTYVLDGNQFTFMSSNDSPICPEHSGVYQIQITDDGQIVAEREREECPNRRAEPISPFIRVSP